jgi:hypothetical protein
MVPNFNHLVESHPTETRAPLTTDNRPLRCSSNENEDLGRQCCDSRTNQAVTTWILGLKSSSTHVKCTPTPTSSLIGRVSTMRSHCICWHRPLSVWKRWETRSILYVTQSHRLFQNKRLQCGHEGHEEKPTFPSSAAQLWTSLTCIVCPEHERVHRAG